MQFIVEIPDDTANSGLFEDAATSAGWQATIEDGEGETIPNPLTAIAACFYYIVMPELKRHAITTRADQAKVDAQAQAETDIQAAIVAWQAAMQGGG